MSDQPEWMKGLGDGPHAVPGEGVEAFRKRVVDGLPEMRFTDYRHDSLPLPILIANKAHEIGVQPHDFLAALSMLAPLAAKTRGGEFHLLHSYRVALLAERIARAEFAEPKALFFAGLLHDVGKALVPACTLCATERWTDEDRRNMEPHVIDGFRLLRDRFDFTAHVIVRHHRNQSGGYPTELPFSLQPFSEETLERVSRYARMLTIADVFDAMHRVNSGSDGVALTEAQIRERMLKIDLMVAGFYERGVFTFKGDGG